MQAIKTELNLLQNNGDTVDEIISYLEEDFPDAVDAVIQVVAAAFGS